MGCMGYLLDAINKKLKRRVQKSSFFVDGYPAGVFGIDKYNLICVFTHAKISFWDYSNTKKSENDHTFGSLNTTFKFSDKDDTLEIRASNAERQICTIKKK